MCKGLWRYGFIIFFVSCGQLNTTRGENTTVFESIFTKDVLENIYSRCYLAPFGNNLYFEGAFRFVIFLSKNSANSSFRITRQFYPPVDRCAQAMISERLESYQYQGADLTLEDDFYFLWPANFSDS